MTYKDTLSWLDSHTIGNLEAKAMISKALEKQIPKTPKIFKEKYMQPDYLCPTCDADVDHEWDCCAGCGQALNWEGVFE